MQESQTRYCLLPEIVRDGFVFKNAAAIPGFDIPKALRNLEISHSRIPGNAVFPLRNIQVDCVDPGKALADLAAGNVYLFDILVGLADMFGELFHALVEARKILAEPGKLDA